MDKWIVVENNGKKMFPSEAKAIYIADVTNFDKFNQHLKSTKEYGYKLTSYGSLFAKRHDLAAMRVVAF